MTNKHLSSNLNCFIYCSNRVKGRKCIMSNKSLQTIIFYHQRLKTILWKYIIFCLGNTQRVVFKKAKKIQILIMVFYTSLNIITIKQKPCFGLFFVLFSSPYFENILTERKIYFNTWHILFTKVLLGNTHFGDGDHRARKEMAIESIKIIGWIFLKSYSTVDMTAQFIWCKHSQ